MHVCVLYLSVYRFQSDLLSLSAAPTLLSLFAGKPTPKVTWFLENALIDDSYEITGGRTINHLTFPNVGRQHLKARLICQATNNNLVPPVNKIVILDINCKYHTSTVFRF